jgi:hypothetical protein
VTGRIEILAAVDRPGLITCNSGPSRFHYTYRSPLGGIDGLAEGQLVTFELEKGSPLMAISVCVKETGDQSPSAREVRYRGFEQTNNVRSYKFQTWQAGEENQEAIVTVDLALFRRHGITLQEGPALCLRLVQAEMQQPGSSAPVWKRALTDQEMLTHVALRATKTKKRS